MNTSRGVSTSRLLQLAREYPEPITDIQIADVDRVSFHLRLVVDRHGPGAVVCDVGGGIGLFSVGAAAHGLTAIVVDDLKDPIVERCGEAALKLHERLGVRVLRRDAISHGLDLPAESVDAVTAFETMEHWHNSPKRLLHDALAVLRPGGSLIIGVPNAVNLRKRLTVPFGRGKWSSMEDWYEQPAFRGHVREPDVDDLQYIGRDLGLVGVQILGCNWSARRSPRRTARLGIRFIDRILVRFPSLCSDIYLIGHKPGSSAAAGRSQ